MSTTSNKLQQGPQELLDATRRRYSHEINEPILTAIPVVSRAPLEYTLSVGAILGGICALAVSALSPKIDLQDAFYIVWIPTFILFAFHTARKITHGVMLVTETHYVLFELRDKCLDGGLFKESTERPAKLPKPSTHKGAIIGDGPLPFEQAEKGFWYYSSSDYDFVDVIKLSLIHI